MTNLTTKIIKNNAHMFQCDICYEMERRDYKAKEEEKYFNDKFTNELRPIKYKLVLQVDKGVFDKWLVCPRTK